MKSIAQILFLFFSMPLIAQDYVINLLDQPVLETQEGDPKVKLWNISNPQMLVFKPTNEISANTAIVICPGGGYDYLSMENEGYNVANWLTDMGVTAIILKYRLPKGNFDEKGRFNALLDAQAAIEIVRKSAEKWNLDSQKIGIMGFSAGGHLAASVSNHFTQESRPDFSILIYPVISLDEEITHQGTKNNILGENIIHREKYSNELQVSENTPPTFLLHSLDDKSVPVENSLYYYSAMKEKEVGGELHILQYGGHGYGMAFSRKSVGHWSEILKAWLQRNGWAI